MTVRRIVANIAVDNAEAAARFYGGVFELDILMDLGWIITFGSEERMQVQLSVMTEGGSGTPVSNISIEVDDLDATWLRAVQGGYAIEYGPIDEPWGVRRFFVRDPFGRLVNVLAHL